MQHVLYLIDIHVHFTDGGDKASDSTSENGDHEEACPRSTRKSGELLHDRASDRNLHKRERNVKDVTDSVLETKRQKIPPSSDAFHPHHKKTKRSKSKRKHKKKSADWCDNSKLYGKKRARKNSSPDDPTLLDLPCISSMKRRKEERMNQREEKAIVGSRVLGSPMEDSESVVHSRRHISPHGSGRSHAGTYVGEKCMVHMMCM